MTVTPSVHDGRVIRWVEFERTGQSIAAMHDGCRVGVVARYGDRWEAFTDGRVPGGPWATIEEAQAAFEDAWQKEQG